MRSPYGKSIKYFVLVLAACVAAACSSSDVQPPEANPLPPDTPKGEGLFSGKSGNILDVFSGGSDGFSSGLGVNSYLWRASLEAISFMPILEVDSAGGVILTDWYQNPENMDERLKVNIYILGRKLTPQALKVTMFRQEDKNGRWMETPANAATVSALEETILTRARRLRVEERAAE